MANYRTFIIKLNRTKDIALIDWLEAQDRPLADMFRQWVRAEMDGDDSDAFDWGLMRRMLETVIDEKGISVTGTQPAQPIPVDDETNDKIKDMF